MHTVLLKGLFALGQARPLAGELALSEALDPKEVDQAPAPHGKVRAIGGTGFCERFVFSADAYYPDLCKWHSASLHMCTSNAPRRRSPLPHRPLEGHVMTDDRILSMVETETLALIALTEQGFAW